MTIDERLKEVTTGRQSFSMDHQLFDLFNSLLRERGYSSFFLALRAIR